MAVPYFGWIISCKRTQYVREVEIGCGFKHFFVLQAKIGEDLFGFHIWPAIFKIFKTGWIPAFWASSEHGLGSIYFTPKWLDIVGFNWLLVKHMANIYIYTSLGGSFKYFFNPDPGKNDPIWLIFFEWVETTNHIYIYYIYVHTCLFIICRYLQHAVSRFCRPENAFGVWNMIWWTLKIDTVDGSEIRLTSWGW